MAGKAWTAEDLAELDRLRKAGTPAKRIAAHFGRTINSVRIAALRHGLDPIPPDVALANLRAMNRPGERRPYPRGRRLTPEHRAAIARGLREGGKSEAANPVRAESLRAYYADPEARARVGRGVHEARMAWCPESYRAEYRYLVDVAKCGAKRARALILEQIERDRRRAMAERHIAMMRGSGRASRAPAPLKFSTRPRDEPRTAATSNGL
jgi:hypothetical protein